LAIRFIGDDKIWASESGIIQTRQFQIFAYNPLNPSIEVPINDYNINWKGEDETFNIEAQGNLITIKWDNTNIPDDATSGTIEILITNSNPEFPYRHCFIKNGELNIDYEYINFKLEGDYSDVNMFLWSKEAYLLQGDFANFISQDINYVIFSSNFSTTITGDTPPAFYGIDFLDDSGSLYFDDLGGGMQQVQYKTSDEAGDDAPIWTSANGFTQNDYDWADGTHWDANNRKLIFRSIKTVEFNNIYADLYSGSMLAYVQYHHI